MNVPVKTLSNAKVPSLAALPVRSLNHSASGMVGAALLAGRAAIKLGAGKVFLGLLTERAPHVDYLQPELMLRKPEALLADVALTAIAAGPGMGTDPAAQRLIFRGERQ